MICFLYYKAFRRDINLIYTTLFTYFPCKLLGANKQNYIMLLVHVVSLCSNTMDDFSSVPCDFLYDFHFTRTKNVRNKVINIKTLHTRRRFSTFTRLLGCRI